MNAYIDPSRKVLRHPEVLMKLRAGKPTGPVNVEMDLSARCNLACRWCDFAHLRGPADMPPYLAISAFRDLAGAGAKAVTFTGGGEPTLNPHFAAIVRSARFAGLRCGLYTNGVEIEQLVKVADFLDWAYISLDEVTRCGYEDSKGADLFGEVCANIRALVKVKGNSTLGVGFLLHAGNWPLVTKMASLAHDLRADYCQFRPVIGLHDYGWVLQAIEALETVDPVFCSWSAARFRETLGFARLYEVCRASALVPCIGADGTVWACPNTRGLRPLGNLASQSFAAIWARRPVQVVGDDCRVSCRNHALNETLEYVCSEGPHDSFV